MEIMAFIFVFGTNFLEQNLKTTKKHLTKYKTEKRAADNTRFIQFGRKYKAFAKVVPSGKTFICALQMAKKHLALLVAFR
jgi:hypothetical protein